MVSHQKQVTYSGEVFKAQISLEHVWLRSNVRWSRWLSVGRRLDSTILTFVESVHRSDRRLRRWGCAGGVGIGGWCSTSVIRSGSFLLSGTLLSMSTFLQENPFNAIEYTFFESFASGFFFGFALLLVTGVGGAGCCGDEGWVRPLVTAGAGAEGGGMARCCGVPIPPC